MRHEEEHLLEILGGGDERPLFAPDPQARLEHVVRQLTAVADWLEKSVKANPDFYKSLKGYHCVNDIREQALGLTDIALILNEFYRLDENAWQAFNAEYIAKGKTK